MPGTTEQSLAPLPSLDELAWVDHVVADAAGKALVIVETLEQAFTFDKVEGTADDFRSRAEFEPMTLEHLGSLLLLARGLVSSGGALQEYAERLARAADSIYDSSADRPNGLVATPAGVEPYLTYRQRIAAGYTAAAEDADAVVEHQKKIGMRA